MEFNVALNATELKNHNFCLFKKTSLSELLRFSMEVELTNFLELNRRKTECSKKISIVLTTVFQNQRAIAFPGKPSSDTHDQIRKITLKTTTVKTTTFNRKKFGICLREKTMIDYVICTVIPKVKIT
jgi:hypothetical protein